MTHNLPEVEPAALFPGSPRETPRRALSVCAVGKSEQQPGPGSSCCPACFNLTFVALRCDLQGAGIEIYPGSKCTLSDNGIHHCKEGILIKVSTRHALRPAQMGPWDTVTFH